MATFTIEGLREAIADRFTSPELVDLIDLDIEKLLDLIEDELDDDQLAAIRTDLGWGGSDQEDD